MPPSAALEALLLLSVCVLLLPPICHGGRILVFPLDGSHWINMKVLIEELHARGHDITVIRNINAWYITEESPLYTSITIPDKSMDKEVVGEFLRDTMASIQHGSPMFPVSPGRALRSIWTMQSHFTKMLDEAHRLLSESLAAILNDKGLIERFRKFDLFLTDPGVYPGVILARYLKLPLVLNVRWVTTLEAHSVIAPYPLSYIPMTSTGFTDRMTFIQRVENVLMRAYELYRQRFVIIPHYQAILDKHFDGEDIASLLQEADIWLMRSDFVFEYPRPTMPNVVYIGGFQCQPAQPLPPELEQFVQSAGEAGVVVMSLSTFMTGLSKSITDQIASVFAKLPQKVIWRLPGERPSTLGNNTLLVDWMPQRDLLGHPQTRAFVAHGGTNGVQEAIYHGTPVLGIPFFFDQHDNLLRLQERGAAKILELPNLNGPSFRQALEEVLHHATYRQNMQRLSRLHRDQPIKPLDSAIFWLEFVMRHKGASHLRSQAYRMPWYSYYCVDVLLLLLAAGMLLLLSTAALLRLLCCRGRRKTKTKLH